MSGDTRSFREIELEGWDSRATTYGPLAGSFTQHAAPHLLKATAVGKGARVLDVACGPGYVSGAAAALGAETLGLDFAPSMVTEARRTFPALRFEEGDGEALSVPDASFDAVICAFGLLHMARPDAAVREAFRVLKPGGRYAYSVWALEKFFKVIADVVAEHGNPNVPMPPAPPMFRFADAVESRDALNAAGFVDTSLEAVDLHWYPETPQTFLDFIDKSAVRSSLLISLQTPEAKVRIRQAILDHAKDFEEDGRLKVVWRAVIGSGRKPG
jgi:SAM-dependent methyltransferase